MKKWIQLYVFLISISIGSFINVVIYRVPLKLSLWNISSFCPSCRRKLEWVDMIPIFSYFHLKGKCRTCGIVISIQYVLVEIVSGIFGLLCLELFSFTIQALLIFLIGECLLAISFIDHRYMIIPNGITIWILLFCFILGRYNDLSFIDQILGLLIVPLFMICMNIVFKESFGYGDIKLIGACGLALGPYNTVYSMMIAVISASFYSIYLLISEKQSFKDHIPFGGYISFGVIVMLLSGELFTCLN